MIGVETTSGVAGAVLLVGIVLVEALILYVGYGALERMFGPRIARMLRGE